MNHFEQRRGIILAALALPLAGCVAPVQRENAAFAAAIAQLETTHGGRLGVAAFDTGSRRWLQYRADERFPMCSTFKIIPAAAMLARGDELINLRIHYGKEDLLPNSPITEKHLLDGMSNADLCAATLQYSDNAAANLLMKQLGGPAGMTAFARSRGDDIFQLDRWETELNSAIPGDPRDTTSPLAMLQTLQKLTLGDGLPGPARTTLLNWMFANTTGNQRMRAGVPAGWKVADKTGGGSYGTNNSIGLLFPPSRPPIVAAVFHTQDQKEASAKNEVIAAATRAVVEAMRG
ncbi:MAG TPA: class A beta-lactamase [Telluria sp.]|nr:class A beta-lactamase [Telluria sp.]